MSNLKAATAPVVVKALHVCKKAFWCVVIFSFCINLLMLTIPLYMLQLFDRVITARSPDTLIYLTVIALAALLVLGVLDAVRGRVLTGLGTWLESRLGGPLLSAALERAMNRPSGRRGIQSLRDLQTVRGFIAGPGALPILDAPWTPVFLIIIFILHPWLGLAATGGAVILLVLAVANNMASSQLTADADHQARNCLFRAEAAVRNSDAVMSMGIRPDLIKNWDLSNGRSLDALVLATQRSGALASASKFLRLALQICTLGIGGALVLKGELTGGGMIAGSILMGRALAPVDQAIVAWRSALAAKQAFNRINKALANYNDQSDAITLPRPSGHLAVEELAFLYHPGGDPVLRGVSFKLEAGDSLGVIGPTAAGKSTLARLIVGNLAPSVGHIRLDDADIFEWDADDRGKYVGYLPQDIEVFDASVAENIARLQVPDSEAVIDAAKLAGVHELILRLPDGYETQVGPEGMALSGGQRQRIALARAVFANPSLVVLDEPNAHLDQDGETALLDTMSVLKKRKTTTIINAHRPSILQQVDYILVLRDGITPVFGPRDEIMKRLAPKTEKDKTKADKKKINKTRTRTKAKKPKTNITEGVLSDE